MRKMMQIMLSYYESNLRVCSDRGSSITTITARERTVRTRMKML